MAAIVQADPYQRLIRKIGYSVGLEEIVDRVKKLVALYVRDRAVSASAFENLVVNEFGRKKTAAHHFRNFYGTLNLVRPVGRDIEPLYQLDSLSILKRIFADDEQRFDTAVKVVLTQCIVEEDADIFLNGLISDFRPDQMRTLLESMVRTKRQQATQDMRTPSLLSKIYEVIDIKNQSSPETNGEQDAVPQGRFGKRTEPLNSFRRTAQLTPTIGSNTVVIPDDYLGKASKTRKAWAQDLGLFHGGKKTARATELLGALKKRVISVEPQHSAALFWGYKSDLDKMRSRLQIGIAEAPSCEPWDLLDAIARAFVVDAHGSVDLAPDCDEVISFLGGAFDLYKQGNSTKGLIRNSLPMYVAEPVLASWCVAKHRQLPELKGILETEFNKQSRRRVQRMLIRGTAGALFFMR